MHCCSILLEHGHDTATTSSSSPYELEETVRSIIVSLRLARRADQADLNFHVTIMKTRREITCCCSRESVTKARTKQELREEHERAVM
jgi:hypothetical protein